MNVASLFFINYNSKITDIGNAPLMAFFFPCKPLWKWSLRNAVWLVVVLFLFYLLTLDVASILEKINITVALSDYNGSRPANAKFILLWRHEIVRLNLLKKCKYCPVNNCAITENRLLFQGDHSRFDAIIFDESHLMNKKKQNPKRRSSSQIYIFSSHESSSVYPACELLNEDFFNLTFTYKLDSDLVWRFFVVRNLRGDIVAPRDTVQWNVTKHPIAMQIKSIFQRRTKAVAWLVSNCDAQSLRHQYLTILQEHLFHYSLQIDVYGKCTKRRCDDNDCEEMLKRNYYFYIAFENSIAKDYVTEKVLHGYDNYVVPIVYGGANYSKFLPPGSYINAAEIHPYNLAHIIQQAIKHAEIYESFFHWTNHYTIDSDYNNYHPVCELCKAMNNKEEDYAPAKKQFRLWWNSLYGMKWCLPKAFWKEYNILQIDKTHIDKHKYI